MFLKFGRYALWLLAMLCWTLGFASAQPLESTSLLSRYSNTAWDDQDGAPVDVGALAQTKDGWLWLGSGTGLFRFDGYRFERSDVLGGQPLPGGKVMSLLATRDGGLWIGHFSGGVSYFKQGELRRFSTKEGLGNGSIYHLAEAPDGSIWAAALGVYRYAGGHWQRLGAEVGLPDKVVVLQVVFDQRGTTWVVTLGAGSYMCPAGQSRFQLVASDKGPRGTDGVGVVAIAPDQTNWLVHSIHGVFKYEPDTGKLSTMPPSIPHKRSESIIDRQFGLWASSTASLMRIDLSRPDFPVQTLSIDKGLTGSPSPILQDEDGNIWVGTSGGLNRLRPNRLSPLVLPNDLIQLGMSALPNGKLLLSASGGHVGLYERDNEGSWMQYREVGRPTCLYTDPAGVSWIGTGAGVWRKQDKQLRFFPLPVEAVDHDVQSMTVNPEGGLWVSVVGAGLFLLRDGVWTTYGKQQGLPDSATTFMLTEVGGRSWFGYPQNQVAMLQQGKVRLFGSKDGLDIGFVLALSSRQGQLWVGGEKGLAYFNGQRFVPVLGSDGQVFRGVSGLVQTPDGGLWLHGAEGVSHIVAGEVTAVLRDPTHGVVYEQFNGRDGLAGRAAHIRPLPSLVEAPDGRLWYATVSDLGWIDPAHIQRNPLPPRIQIMALIANGQRYEPKTPLILPEGTRNLQVAYTALSLSVPERVRFRYQLVGVDTGWQDPGKRREAFYTNLAPGKYSFRVIAANEDGVWNQTGATFDFQIKPTFVQGPWFIVCCVLLVLALLYLLYLLRMRQITRRMEARLQERERIARVLHDTLLQGVQALVLRFGTISQQLAPHPGSQSMERALQQADQLIEDSRDQVMDLRAASEYGENLAGALQGCGAMLAERYGTVFRLEVVGTPWLLKLPVREHVYYMAREALLNAFQHAKARQVMLQLDYGRRQFQLRVMDDGQGFDETILDTGGRPGHWGLIGMRERAGQLGGSLTIANRSEQGCLVEFNLRAGLAYSRSWQNLILGGV